MRKQFTDTKQATTVNTKTNHTNRYYLHTLQGFAGLFLDNTLIRIHVIFSDLRHVTSNLWLSSGADMVPKPGALLHLQVTRVDWGVANTFDGGKSPFTLNTRRKSDVNRPIDQSSEQKCMGVRVNGI